MPIRAGALRALAQIRLADEAFDAALDPTALDRLVRTRHTVCMKRTNLVLDEILLADAVRITGEKTYSGAVNFALRELIRLKQAASIFDLAGTGAWSGDLSEMRADRPRRQTRPRKRP